MKIIAKCKLGIIDSDIADIDKYLSHFKNKEVMFKKLQNILFDFKWRMIQDIEGLVSEMKKIGISPVEYITFSDLEYVEQIEPYVLKYQRRHEQANQADSKISDFAIDSFEQLYSDLKREQMEYMLLCTQKSKLSGTQQLLQHQLNISDNSALSRQRYINSHSALVQKSNRNQGRSQNYVNEQKEFQQIGCAAANSSKPLKFKHLLPGATEHDVYQKNMNQLLEFHVNSVARYDRFMEFCQKSIQKQGE